MKKILIIEDDEFLRSLAVKRLEKEGYTVLIAPTGEAGLTTAAAEKPDLILLDLLLPNLPGLEVLEKFKQSDTLKDLPVIVFSNLGAKDDIEKATALGAVSYMVKSNFTLDEVAAKVKDILK